MMKNSAPLPRYRWTALVLALWVSGAAVSQQADGSKVSPASPWRQGLYEVDPNLPPDKVFQGNLTTGGSVTWQYPKNLARFNPFIPKVGINAAAAEYLGFVEGDGTYMEKYSDHAIYVYNGRTRTLTKRYDRFADIAADLFPRMRNSTVEYMLPANQPAYPTDGQRRGSSKPEPDLNFPGPATPQVDQQPWPIVWTYGSGTGPTVPAVNLTAALTPPEAHELGKGPDRYLGFNDEGAWVESGFTGHIYVWSAAKLRLKTRFHDIKSVPRALLLSLHNAQIDGLLSPPTPKPSVSAPAAPAAAPSARSQAAAAVMGDPETLRRGLAGFQQPAQGSGTAGQGAHVPGAHVPALAGGTAPESVVGTQAAVSANMLTFIAADGTKQSFAVVRPKLPNVGTMGIAGSWIAPREQMLFTVQPDNTVRGQKVPPQLLPSLPPSQ